MKKNSVTISSGWAKGMGLATPADLRTRPTASRVREAVMSSLAQHLDGARFLDLFAGSGAMGLEAASRGALGVAFVEGDPHVSQLLRKNIDELRRRAHRQGLPEGSWELIEGRVESLWTPQVLAPRAKDQRGVPAGRRDFSQSAPQAKAKGKSVDLRRLRALGPFDLVYIDPPYAQAVEMVEPLLGGLGEFLSPTAVVVFESRSGHEATTVGELIERSGTFELMQAKTYGAATVTMFRSKEDTFHAP